MNTPIKGMKVDLSRLSGHCGWTIVNESGIGVAVVYATLIDSSRPDVASYPENAADIALAHQFAASGEVLEALAGLADAVDALEAAEFAFNAFERLHPNGISRKWDDLFFAKNAAEDRLLNAVPPARAALALAKGES
jgi:hypothetical protein